VPIFATGSIGVKVHVCEECGVEFLPVRKDQRWCDDWCREQFRNAELRVARQLYAQWKRDQREDVDERTQEAS
jgi:hypothetical protein